MQWVKEHQFDVLFELTFANVAALREQHPSHLCVAALIDPALDNSGLLRQLRRVRQCVCRGKKNRRLTRRTLWGATKNFCFFGGAVCWSARGAATPRVAVSLCVDGH
jgi:hypothetical protein